MKGNRIAERTNEAVLRERISELRRRKVRIVREINTSETRLREALSISQWKDLDELCREAERATFQKNQDETKGQVPTAG